MRFKSQALQNLPLTGIKASNLINSVAWRGRGGLDGFFFFASGKGRRRGRVNRREKDSGIIKLPGRDHQEH